MGSGGKWMGCQLTVVNEAERECSTAQMLTSSPSKDLKYRGDYRQQKGGRLRVGQREEGKKGQRQRESTDLRECFLGSLLYPARVQPLRAIRGEGEHQWELDTGH